MKKSYIIGDIHGQYNKLVTLLQGANLVDDALAWRAGDAHLYFTGDFFDRGKDGLASVDLVMRLQRDAVDAGGVVESLIGNHEVMILASHRFGDKPVVLWADSFKDIWLRNGGQPADLHGLTAEHVAWLTTRPAMIHCGNVLLIHADTLSYMRFGNTIEEVNATIAEYLQSDDRMLWDQLLVALCERFAFSRRRHDGAQRARAFLDIYGGQRLIHGHTPIPYVTQSPPATVDAPLHYAEGLCVNVDGGMYQGGAGFVYQLEDKDNLNQRTVRD